MALLTEYVNRAAPEVVKDGLYSHASDVFCFGQLMWWVINGFCEAEDPSTQVAKWELVGTFENIKKRHFLCFYIHANL